MAQEKRVAGPKRVMDVHIVAVDRPIWSGKAAYVMLPSQEGYMGILPDHEPMLAIVGTGDVTLTDEMGEKRSFPIEGGFISFHDNELTMGVDRFLA